MSIDVKQLFKHGLFLHKLSGIWPENDEPLGSFYHHKRYGIMALNITICLIPFSAFLGDVSSDDFTE